MRPDNLIDFGAQPHTRNELQIWVRDHLQLAPELEAALLVAIDAVFTRHERLWQESKHEAIQALSAGFADKMGYVPTVKNAVLPPELKKELDFTPEEQANFFVPDLGYIAEHNSEWLEWWNKVFKA